MLTSAQFVDIRTAVQTWVSVGEGTDEEIQHGDAQNHQKNQLQSDDPLDARHVDS